jgi:branched-chain amino acid transport system ATP-binding protein
MAQEPVLNPSEQPCFRVEGLSHSFGGLKAVSNVRLSAQRGDIVGLIGPNGAGKTTVFNLITGVYRPDEGRVMLGAADITGLPSHRIVAAGVSRTFQNIRLFRSMTVLENVITAGFSRAGYSLAAAFLRTPSFRDGERAMRKRALALLDGLGLADRGAELAASLPYGLQRKVELARALMSDPAVLLLDEPGAGMNPAELDGLIELVQWARKNFSPAIVLIEHRMRLVMKLCGRVTVLDFGKVIFEGAPGELSGSPAVVKAYFGGDDAAS